jgi:hypothetical protein
MTEDNKFEEFLKTKAQGYNAPPAHVPREDMWSAIQAKRAAGPRVVYGGGATYLVRHRFGMKVWIGAAAAAMLLVATGVGIGRWTATTPQTVATAPSSTLTTNPVVVPTPDGVGRDGSIRTEVAPVSGGASSGNADREVSGQAGRVTAPRSLSGNDTRVAVAPPSTQTTSSAYQLTAVQHLSEAEALLTSFRTPSNAGEQTDALLAEWARRLLSRTRLLLDSPVANDPQRRPLLQDLELVLVQIVQLSPGSAPQDRELIEKTLQQDHVMTRLRTAIPAGSQRGS